MADNCALLKMSGRVNLPYQAFAFFKIVPSTPITMVFTITVTLVALWILLILLLLSLLLLLLLLNYYYYQGLSQAAPLRQSRTAIEIVP